MPPVMMPLPVPIPSVSPVAIAPPVFLAELLEARRRFTLAPTVGKSAPRLEPYASAAARAASHDSRVAGLLCSARSTMSGSSSKRTALAAAESLPNAADVAGEIGGVGAGGGVRTDGGTVQGAAGLGGAPATPSMRGRAGAQPTASMATIQTTNRVRWRYTERACEPRTPASTFGCGT